MFVLGFLLLATGARAGDTAPENVFGREPFSLPVRGLHLMAPSRTNLSEAIAFIENSLPKEGVNTLILEFDYNYDFQSESGFTNQMALNRDEAHRIAKACQTARIELIPQINCLGHQSWAKNTGRLLTLHPEFDETPGKYPNNEGIYCRSYCPLHPEVHKVLFHLIDELAKACEAKSFHVGMDEIFILADEDCPRCKGKTTAQIFAGEVRTLRDHLQQIGCRTWLWGDRFLDAKTTKLGKWEASENETQPAIDLVPKDIVVCDWHYEKAPDTPLYFAQKGFDVVICPWRKTDVALREVQDMQALRANADPQIAGHALGVVQTTWAGFVPFTAAYRSLGGAQPPSDRRSSFESAQCFAAVFKALRGEK